MKKSNMKRWASLAVAGIAFAAASLQSPAAESVVKYPFDTDINGWGIGWGGQGAVAWDGAQDSSNNVSSGSIYITANGTAGDQLVALGWFSGSMWWNPPTALVDLTAYTNISFDIKWDPANSTVELPVYNSTGETLQFWGVPQDNGSWITLGSVPIPAGASNGWVSVNVPVNPLIPGINTLGGLGFKKYTETALTGTAAFWVDNIVLHAAAVILPPPTISPKMTTPVSGLNLFSALGGGEYQRTSIKYTSQTGISFVGQPSDVTYSFTIKEYPNPDIYTNYQAHIFLTTGAGTASALDYNDPNLIWLNIQGSTNGGAIAYFRYKINEPNANTNLFDDEYTAGTAWAGQLTNLPAATPLGTWSMTFSQDTNVMLRGPGGVSVALTIRPEVAAMFAEPLNLVYGAQPNRPSEALATFNQGQKVVLSNVALTNGTTAVIYDNFLADQTLNTNLWTELSGVPRTALLFPNDPGQRLLSWNLPDGGFTLERGSTILGPWAPVSSSATYTEGTNRFTLLSSAALGGSEGYFRLVKRAFSKLQILLPGETAAPGTPTGKTGTPTTQQVGASFDVIVRAVDQNWFPIGGITDQVTLSSTEASFSWSTFPRAMVDGVASFTAENSDQVSFGAAGSFTITATDSSDPTKTADTSSAVTVNP